MADHDDHGADGATVSADDEALLPAAPETRPSHRLRWASLGVVLLGVAVAGVFAWREVAPVVTAGRYRDITYQVPKAPQLTARPGETVYRIDPTHSSLTYEVTEKFVGRSDSTAKGLTNGISGDLAVNAKDPDASRVGTIVANVEQFHSDNNLRDARLRQDYLQSHRFPLAELQVSKLTGLRGPLVKGTTQRFTMNGFVTIKGIGVPVTFDATATVGADGNLTATATTTAKLSRFGAGPISIAGMVRTTDDVKLTVNVQALDPTQHAIPSTITGPHAKTADASASPSYAKVVAPILAANCASCHNTGQMGADHVTIDTAGDARAISDGIKTVTQTRYMPPWPASDKGLPLTHKMTLTNAQIASLGTWADAGAPLDVADNTPLTPPKATKRAQPRRDATMKIPAYTGSLDNVNDYRCFVLDPQLTEAKFLTGYTFLTDQIQELHHAQVFHISAQQRASAVAVDGKDGRSGWSCYGGPGLRGKRPPTVAGRDRNHDVGFAGQADLVAGWVPGQAPVIYPEHSGVYLQPGDALVLQIHYHYREQPTPDESGLALQLDPVSPAIKALRVVNPLGPVEIPCAPKDQSQPLCNRDAAIADNAKHYGAVGAGNEAGLLALCGKTPEELTKNFDGQVAHSSCVATVPESGTMIGAMGHMHTLGKSIRLTLDPETPKPQILLDIPRWSFDWQMNYGFQKPIHVDAGQKILLDCAWDRAADPTRPAKYIVFAEGTEDEMCFATYTLIPDNQ
jgi:polyisoprenoid-binding protein YceI